MTKEKNKMPILKSPPRPPKNETLQLRIEEDVKSKLGKYAEFIDSSESYVVSEALKLLFRKDDEFKTWLETQTEDGKQPQNSGGSLFEVARKV
jgi:predicted transcriptional regulator